MRVTFKLPARCCLALVSGTVYTGAFPPLDWGWMVILGIAGLLLAIRGESGSRARLIGFLHGLAVFGISLSWLWNIFGTVAILLWGILALFTALFADMQIRAAARGFRGYGLAFFTAANWCAFEFIRAEIFPLKLPMDDSRSRDGTECFAAMGRSLWGELFPCAVSWICVFGKVVCECGGCHATFRGRCFLQSTSGR